jgi:hypothetical protein
VRTGSAKIVQKLSDDLKTANAELVDVKSALVKASSDLRNADGVIAELQADQWHEFRSDALPDPPNETASFLKDLEKTADGAYAGTAHASTAEVGKNNRTVQQSTSNNTPPAPAIPTERSRVGDAATRGPSAESRATFTSLADVRSVVGTEYSVADTKTDNREGPVVKVPENWPNITQLKEWDAANARGLVAASKYTDKGEVVWYNNIRKDGMIFEELANCEPRYMSLDAKLCTALRKIKRLPPELDRRITRKEIDAVEKGTTLTGRQVVYMIYEWFRNDEDSLSVVHSFKDLNDLKWMGDDQMDRFNNLWDTVVHNFEGHEDVPAKVIRDMFHERWSQSKVLKGDVEYYERLATDHDDRSLAFMKSSIERYLRRQRTRRNREAQEKAYKGGTGNRDNLPSLEAAPAVKTAAKPKRGARSSSRSRNKGEDGGGAPSGTATAGRKLKKFEDLTENDFCWYFQQPVGCPRTDEDCRYVHKRAPKAILSKMKAPKSRSTSQSRTGKGKSKGKGKGTVPHHCHEYLRTGKCTTQGCKHPHLTKDQYATEKDKMKKAAE